MNFLDDLQFIDWEVESDREDTCDCDEFEDCESTVEISDCASCASSSSTSAEMLPELPKVRTNILILTFCSVMAFVSHSLWCFVCNSFLRDYHF